MTLYTTGIADPPWPERGGGKVKRGADRHYPLMSVAEICALPVSRLFAENAHLYLWTTNNHLEVAFKVVRAWEFEFVTCITWGKAVIKPMRLGRGGVPVAFPALQVQTGLGQYFRGSSEQLLFCKRGKIPYRVDPVTGKRAQGRTLVLAPRGEHSAKPDGVRTMVERVSPGPYVELFARKEVAGWDRWGNEVDSNVKLR
jgi:N6-adenosine-specific RNA methylase IME4